METNLTPEQSQALSATVEVPLTVVDPITNRRYVLVSADDYAKLDTIKAIGTGIAQMENQEGQDLTEAISDIRNDKSSGPMQRESVARVEERISFWPTGNLEMFHHAAHLAMR